MNPEAWPAKLDGKRSPHTVTAALRRFGGPFRVLHKLPAHEDEVLDWLCACQTSALGGRMATCKNDCGWSSPVYNSCTNRHCPQCRGGVRTEWLAARQGQLLPVPHFQVVFTVPKELRPLARRQPRRVYDLMFRAAAEVLQTLAAQKFDAQLGILAVLHTWSQDLGYHPHIHCLVTGGGLRADQEAWVETSPTFLFPTSVMAPLFRGKVLEGLRNAEMAGKVFCSGEPEEAKASFETAVRKAYQHKWVVHVEAPEGRDPAVAAKYLARYVGGTAISNARILQVSDTHVSFKTREGPRTLKGTEFVRRFAMHILPKGQHRVRYYGLYAPGNVHHRWEQARVLLGAPLPPPRPERPERTCPKCGGPVIETGHPELSWIRPSHPPRAGGSPARASPRSGSPQ